ncbi:uncharacterized protein LOC111248476 isoform X2 [Varroa destructor]|uniref:Cadherin domain-containing protein n=1 Tax=Varroa destructor TaxID=109461 RepID=A0A7M7JTU1_VARDE|nr:uncharacterized protein LOC111248476 isoform X2 [Varroa destructor]
MRHRGHLQSAARACASFVATLTIWHFVGTPIHGLAPNIDYSHNMRILRLPKSTPVGTIVYRLKGSDSHTTTLKFGARNQEGRELLEFNSVNINQADVILKAPLKKENYSVTLFVTDGKETTEVDSSIVVTNGSLSNPFVNTETVVKVPENTPLNTTVGHIRARDNPNSYLPVVFEVIGSSKFYIKYIFGPKGVSSGELQLKMPLDYEAQNVYYIKVAAINTWTDHEFDTRNIIILPLCIVVEDTPDTPPYFIGIPPVIVVNDNTQAGTVIHRIRAVDGDFGAPRNMSYLSDPRSDWADFFRIEPHTGDLSLLRDGKELIERSCTVSLSILKVTAREVESSQEYPPLQVSTEFAVAVVSEENHVPQFAAGKRILGQIAEQSPVNSAVKWTPGQSNKVFDKDTGINSTFKLELEDDVVAAFEVVPRHVLREAEFSLVVRDPSKLRFDPLKDPRLTMKVSAMETESLVPLSAQIEVVVEIIDINDHFPLFGQDSYTAYVKEDALPGTQVITVTATDEDSGLHGKVRYTALLGPMASSFALDPQTGSITLVSSRGLDREKIAEYLLAVEARDEDGNGHKTLAQLRVVVDDANDNTPIFLQPRYDAVLTSAKDNFTQPLVVKAVDTDSPGPNSDVTYEIISGNFEDKFIIEPQQGLIVLKEPLSAVSRTIKLVVRAHDNGIPIQTSTVSIYIHSQEYLTRSLAVVIPRSSFDIQSERSRYEKGLSDLFGAQVSIVNVGTYNDSSRNASLIETQATYDQRRVDLNEALWFLKVLAEGLVRPKPESTVDGSSVDGPKSGNSGSTGSEVDFGKDHSDRDTNDQAGGGSGATNGSHSDIDAEWGSGRGSKLLPSSSNRDSVHKQQEVMHTGIDERILWILVVCFLLAILILLVCLLCCCWRNSFRTTSVPAIDYKHQSNFGLPSPPLTQHPSHLGYDQSYMSHSNTLQRDHAMQADTSILIDPSTGRRSNANNTLDKSYRSSLNRSDQRSVVTRAADHREAPLYEETDDNENAEDSYSRHRYILKELRRQRGQRKGQQRGGDAGADVRRVGSYVLIKKILPDGRFRDREDSLSDLAASLTQSNHTNFLPRRRQRRVRPTDNKRSDLESDCFFEERRMEPKKTEILYIKTPPAPAKNEELNSLDSFDATIAVSADEHFNEELKQCLARSRTVRNQNRKEKIVGHQQQPQHKQDSQQQQASGQTGANEKYPTSGTSVASESEQKSVSFGEERRGLYQRHRINNLRSSDDMPVTSTPLKPTLPRPASSDNNNVCNINNWNNINNNNNNKQVIQNNKDITDDFLKEGRDSSVIAQSEITDVATTNKMTSVSAASDSTRGFRFSRDTVVKGRKTDVSEDDSDSGIGGGPVMTLRNPYFKKKSIFTITYDDVRRTEPLRTACRDSP